MSYKQPLPRARIKAQAKERLAGSWGPVLAATFFYVLCSVIVFWISGGAEGTAMVQDMETSPGMAQLSVHGLYTPHPLLATGMTATGLFGMSVLSVLASILVSGVLAYAYTAWFVDAATNHPQKMTFAGFTGQFSHWARAIKAYIWQVIWVTLWGMLLWPVLVALLTASGIGALTTSGDTGGIMFAASALIFIAVTIFVIYKILHYQVYFPLLADAQGLGVRLGLRQSIAILRGHIGELVLLYLSFIPWGLLCIVTLGLAAFYLIPYLNMTLVYAYIYWRNQAFDQGRIDASLFGYRNTAEQSRPDGTAYTGPGADADFSDAAGTSDVPPGKPPTIQPKDFALKEDHSPQTDPDRPSSPSQPEETDPWTGGNA
jgi:uncharacterized membrane protein